MLYTLTKLNFNLTLPSSTQRLLIEGEGEACTNKKVHGKNCGDKIMHSSFQELR
jgi:hypothetical protein